MNKKPNKDEKSQVPIQKLFTSKLSALKESSVGDKATKVKKHSISANRPPQPKVTSKSLKSEPSGTKRDTASMKSPKIRQVTINSNTKNPYLSDFVLDAKSYDSMAPSMQFDSFADFNNYDFNPSSSTNADSDFYTNPSFSDFNFSNNNRNGGHSSTSSFNDQTHKRYHF